MPGEEGGKGDFGEEYEFCTQGGRLLEERDHARDDFLTAGCEVVGAELGGGEFEGSWHFDTPYREDNDGDLFSQ